MGMNFIGAKVERREDEALLRGVGSFTDDIVLPGTLVAAFVRSQFAHAKIRSVDLEEARKVEGVFGAWAAADLPLPLRDKEMPIFVPTAMMQQVRGFRPLASGEVNYVGEPIAVIVADTRHIAEDAIERVAVDYEPLPVVIDCEHALLPESPLAHFNAKDNIAAQFKVEYGDVDAAFANAAVKVAERFFVHRGLCHAMEGRAVLASHDATTGMLTVWSACQAPHLVKNSLLELLELDDEKLRVIAPDVGGGFGSKGIIYQEEAVLPALSRLLGRPIRWTEDRREHFIATTQERDQVWDMEAAADQSGKLLAVRGKLIHDNGACVPHGVVNPLISATTLPGPYVLPNYRLDVQSVYTNKPAVTPLRGAGRPQAVFVMERLLDRLAQSLGADRAALRASNLVQPEQMPYKVGLRFRDGSPVIYDSGDYPRCQDEVMRKADYAGFRSRQEGARRDGRYIGIGIANYVEGTGLGPFETSNVRVLPDGRVAVASGASPQGQGHKTMLAQIAADAFGVDIDDIEVTVGDTAAVRYGMNTFASRTTVTAGSSTMRAAAKLRVKVLAMAGHFLEERPEDLTIKNRTITTIRPSNKLMPLSQLRRMANGMPGITVPEQFEPGLFVSDHFNPPQAAYANGSHVAEVEVDPGTGGVKILRYCVAHDCGTIINPLIVDGQIQGGVAHGVGNALLEFMHYDDQGQPLTMTLAEYLLPMAPNVPDVEIVHIESPSPNNPLGAKGAGEGGTIPAIAAIVSAVEDALSQWGIRISQAPITPQRICELLDDAERNHGDRD
jgi:carbon-monoxide dehydrogenase large subunit